MCPHEERWRKQLGFKWNFQWNFWDFSSVFTSHDIADNSTCVEKSKELRRYEIHSSFGLLPHHCENPEWHHRNSLPNMTVIVWILGKKDQSYSLGSP